ncbi:SDR family NAD(P)-dependent oxidoreductase [Polynucleobacter sp. es-EL-1]|uniref:SDR family NAD(P)-dependent oxidoreductase n=1 Tax=Polynucleobacter sp. es-EL-1 TaxID=1855652 RepID=UPI001BFD2DC9|nr:SDR family NAD(P)-dependent oxidoreductase [Polynucleobacter sp. es-EL-1]QWE10865.1 SDR family NAD(P)-dependent oxidoreductase [Polynucleobacter sp. es-EL-1]
MKSILIVGGTSGIAKACCKIWASRDNYHFILAVRNEELGRLVANDLTIQYPNSQFSVSSLDFLDPKAIYLFITEIFARNPVNIALIAQGVLPDQKQCEIDLEVARDSIAVNLLSPILFSESVVGLMLKQGHGSLGIIGSVAGDRGRKSNYIYGCAKGALERYCEGLRHRLFRKNIFVSLIKPGPTKTAMTSHLVGGNIALSNVDDVAAIIIDGIGSRKKIIYCPVKWKIIMAILRVIPESIFNRLNI